MTFTDLGNSINAINTQVLNNLVENGASIQRDPSITELPGDMVRQQASIDSMIASSQFSARNGLKLSSSLLTYFAAQQR